MPTAPPVAAPTAAPLPALTPPTSAPVMAPSAAPAAAPPRPLTALVQVLLIAGRIVALRVDHRLVRLRATREGRHRHRQGHKPLHLVLSRLTERFPAGRPRFPHAISAARSRFDTHNSVIGPPAGKKVTL